MRVRTAPAVPHRNEELTMHLFNRLNSRNPEKALDDGVFALEAADFVLKATGQDINVWASVYGRALGTISWTTQVESHAAMAAFGDQLGADSEYQEMIFDAAGLFHRAPRGQLQRGPRRRWTGRCSGQDRVTGHAECAGEPSCIERLDQAGDFFRPGSANTTLSRRVN